MCRRMVCLISFVITLLTIETSVQARIAVSTAMGSGADTYISNDDGGGSGAWRPSTTHGGEVRIQARYLVGVRLRIGYLRFDINGVAGDMTGTTLTMQATFLKSSAKTLNVYGLTDETLDSWDESTISYNNAPGMLPPTPAYGNYTIDPTKLTLLGTITTPAYGATVTVFTSTTGALPLDNFIGADTNKLLTLVLIAQGDSEMEFATKENTNTALIRPTLNLPNASRPQATYPNPTNGSLASSTTVSLQWQAGSYAAKHDVYIGTNSEDVNKATTSTPIIYKGRIDPNNYTITGLIPNTTYYWRIDEVRANGTTIDRGEVWSFNIVSLISWGPTPPDGTSYIAPKMTLRWHAGSGAVKGHNVYLSDNYDQVNNAPAGSTTAPFKVFLTPTGDPNWNPARAGVALAFNKTYFWRIDAVESQTPMVIHKGEVWSFSTVPNRPPTSDPNLVGWWKFDGDLTDSGYGCNGTAYNNPTYDSGVLDNAIFFDNANNTDANDDIYVSLPIGSVISSLSSSTFAVWVNLTGTEGDRRWQRFFSFGTDIYNFMTLSPRQSTLPPTYFEITTGGVTQRASWGPYSTVSGFMITSNEWHHLAVTITEPNEVGTRTFTLYIDGEPCGVNITAILFPGSLGFTTQNWLGRTENPVTQQPYRGYLDDFRIYNRALSQTEIQNILTPLSAWHSSPSNGATNVQSNPTLSWTPGKYADKHNVYFGTDFNDVNDAGTSTVGIYRGSQSKNSYEPGLLEFNATYYWRVDEVNGTNIWKGTIWNFTTGIYLVVDDFEDYNNFSPYRVFQKWVDGYGFSGDDFFPTGYCGNDTGAAVGHDIWTPGSPYYDGTIMETTIIHGGTQSMPLYYNGTGTTRDGCSGTNPLLYSETWRTFDTPQDWTKQGVKALSLWFRGLPPVFLESAGTYTMTGYGSDIWNTADQFRFAYKQLSGDGYIIARVESVQNTDPWAKGGVMIRDGLDPGSKFAHLMMTPGWGCRFQTRPTTGGTCLSDTAVTQLASVTTPHWIKLVRQGSTFTAYDSNDPATEGWHPLVWGPQTIEMQTNVYIGLAVTSHTTDTITTCVARFSNVSTSGSITGTAWQALAIGVTMDETGNTPGEPLYVTLVDDTGVNRTVSHTDPNAVTQNTWQEWNISLSSFTGVKLDRIKKMIIGVGKSTLKSTGLLYIDDIRLYKPRCLPLLAKPAADFNDDCMVNFTDLDTMIAQWLSTATALNVDLNTDNKVDLKDFAKLAQGWLEEILWP